MSSATLSRSATGGQAKGGTSISEPTPPPPAIKEWIFEDIDYANMSVEKKNIVTENNNRKDSVETRKANPDEFDRFFYSLDIQRNIFA